MKTLRLLAVTAALILSVHAQTKVLIVVGPTNHAPGTHEVAAGGRLMKQCLESATNVKGVL